MKNIWIIITIFAVLGVIFMGTGYVLGADTSYNPLSAEEKVSQNKTSYSVTKKETETIREIHIDVLSADIEIIPGDYYGYEILFDRKSSISYRFENGILSVEQEINWLPFHWWPSFSKKTGSIQVFLPKNAELSAVTIETASGNIHASGFSANELDVSTKSGNIDLRQLQARYIDIDVTSGNSTLSDCSVDNFEAGAVSGKITAQNLAVKNSFEADIISGRLSIDGDLRGTTEIGIISGNVSLSLAGKATEYNKNLSSISGSIRINGSKTGSFTENSGASNLLNIHSTSGSITLAFQN